MDAMKKDMWIWVIGGGVLLYFLYSQGYLGGSSSNGSGSNN
jgi:hypothetical protein